MSPTSAEPLTVAIPFYKGHGYLRTAIESVLRQTSPAWRLIVCDDGPETGTEAVVASFQDSRIRYLRNAQNLGMAGNWNRCLESAESDLVNLLHDDDELLPNYVETMLRAGCDYPQAAAFFCRAKVIDADGHNAFSFVDRVKEIFRPRAAGSLHLRGVPAVETLMRGNYIMCPTVCYRRSRLGAERFAAHWRFVLDIEFYSRLLLAGETIVGLPDVAYAYRRHSENATAVYTETLLRFEEESRHYDQIAALARQRGWPSLARIAERKRVIKSHLLFRIGGDVARARFRPALRKWRFLRGVSRHRDDVSA